MARTLSSNWRPRGIDDLEPNAWRALRQRGCVCVVAGPGAGKTEFLAQRAVFLLETCICPKPYRILAISFKTDAAANLSERVRQRCPPELAARFVSLTFDAFTKNLVDRFQSAIPTPWRPTRPYDIDFPKRRAVSGFLESVLHSAPSAWQPAIISLNASNFEAHHVGALRLPLEPIPPQSGVQLAINQWWYRQLRQDERSALTFVGINRLAELLLRANPHLRRALRATYPIVFVDEFQDTTYAQYDFLLSAFADGRTEVTAVGDDKQRIMVWAGARVDAFQRFESDFRAARIPLLFNFRSSPDLVRIQYVIAQALEENAVRTVAQVPRQVSGDVAQVWSSESKVNEAQYLARWLSADMTSRGKNPRDYALLVRQKADSFEAELAGPLAQVGLRIRNESRSLGRTTLQDLLADSVCHIALAVLRLGANRRAPESWRQASAAIEALHVVDSEDEMAGHQAEEKLTFFLAELRGVMAAWSPTSDTASALMRRVFSFLDLSAVARTYQQYATGDLLDIIVEAFDLHLAACAHRTSNWQECLDAFEGVSQIPLMTVHKSKGLEYDTIIFIGLDDQTWWSHRAGDPQGTATFFVALSRAKQRAIFTFCGARGQRRGVADLYQLLAEAGVPEVSI